MVEVGGDLVAGVAAAAVVVALVDVVLDDDYVGVCVTIDVYAVADLVVVFVVVAVDDAGVPAVLHADA